jgi:putative transposase
VLLHLAYLTITTAFSFLGLLPRTDQDKEIEILVLRHQLMVLQRQVTKPAFTSTYRPVHPLAGVAAGTGERLVGLPAHSR